ncbi:MAG: hypothetical protein ACJ79K_05210 [Gemmatimonadaceae bacterium]
MAPEVIGRLRGNYDAQHLFNLLALLVVAAYFLAATRDRAWLPVVAITTAIGVGYGSAVVVISHWITRDDRMTNGGLIMFAAGSTLFLARLVRANEWERARRAKRRAPLANDR